MPKLDLELVRHALNVAKKHGYREVELGIGPDHFHAKMEPAAPAFKPDSDQKSAPETPVLHTVQSNAVGYYAEGSTRLVAGQKISKGDQVAAIEALGLANDLEAKFDGLVVEVLVRPGDSVEYGQVLATVQPE